MHGKINVFTIFWPTTQKQPCLDHHGFGKIYCWPGQGKKVYISI